MTIDRQPDTKDDRRQSRLEDERERGQARSVIDDLKARLDAVKQARQEALAAEAMVRGRRGK